MLYSESIIIDTIKIGIPILNINTNIFKFFFWVKNFKNSYKKKTRYALLTKEKNKGNKAIYLVLLKFLS